jgi:putative sterol carrier protein
MKEETLLKLLTSFFDRLNKNEKAQGELKRFNKTIQFYVSDGEDVLVKVENAAASVAPGRAENPDLELWADTATYASLLKGEVSPGNVWWNRKLKLGWVDRSKPFYPWFTRMIHWFSRERA